VFGYWVIIYTLQTSNILGVGTNLSAMFCSRLLIALSKLCRVS